TEAHHLLSLSLFFLFFSSRRRHTRFSRDWSSDVCSSDLTFDNIVRDNYNLYNYYYLILPRRISAIKQRKINDIIGLIPDAKRLRSEERRVGKEERVDGSSYL